MASDSEDEVLDDLEADAKSSQPDEDLDDVETLADDLSEPQYGDTSDDEDGSTDEDEGDEDEDIDMKSARPLSLPQESTTGPQPMVIDVSLASVVHSARDPPRVPLPPRPIDTAPRERALSPAHTRRAALVPSNRSPRTYAIEAICAIPHPVQTHSLAASTCMSHLLTGSDDGYIRDYDVFNSLNGKVFLTQQQRHHCGIVEGIMKAGQLRTWFENLADPTAAVAPGIEPELTPVYSLALQSDALWGLSGTGVGKVNLFTVRHEPGRILHVMDGPGGPVCALAIQNDEVGFFSGGFLGEVLQWDLHTGVMIRPFEAHTAQIVTIAPRPLSASTPSSKSSSSTSSPSDTPPKPETDPKTKVEHEEDSKSDGSYDPLFDEEPDAEGEIDDVSTMGSNSQRMNNGTLNRFAFPQPKFTMGGTINYSASAPRPGPPPLTPTAYAAYSPDVLMTASIDGSVLLWDSRSDRATVGKLWIHEKTPPWCLSACWSPDGNQIYVGRRNGLVDVWDVRLLSRTSGGTPRLLKSLRNPVDSGVVSCVVALPDSRHIACASNDNIRLWNVTEAGYNDVGRSKGIAPFKIIAGHHGGMISQMLVDAAGRFLVTASGNRGWHGESTRTVLIHDIRPVM